VTTEDFIPVPGRSVVYGFRNVAYWTVDPESGGSRRADTTPDGVPPFIYRPAQIVRVWTPTGMKTCNLVVLLDGSNDRHLWPYADAEHLTLWKTSVVIGEPGAMAIGSEHYLPRFPEGSALA
jgi:hypothetical protein